MVTTNLMLELWKPLYHSEVIAICYKQYGGHLGKLSMLMVYLISNT